MNVPVASVIIPTHNRCAALRRTLVALGRQQVSGQHFEVIVVADGCTDDTAGVLKEADLPYSLKVIEQPSAGPGAARNNGASAARSEILVFLDDDIEATPGFIGAHLRVHQTQSRAVAIGYLWTEMPATDGFFPAGLRLAWEAMFTPMRSPGHRFTYSNLLSGNFSIRRDLFDRVGGFLTDLYVHEDYELGLRLIKAKAVFVFEPNAAGVHHETTDAARSLRRKYHEGMADVGLARLHPELIPTLPLYKQPVRRRERLWRYVAWKLPVLTLRLLNVGPELLRFFEWSGSRRTWTRMLVQLQYGNYWSGVFRAITSQQEIEQLSSRSSMASTGVKLLEVDIREGIKEAEAYIDHERPAAVLVRYGSYVIGHIDDEPGSERLRGEHLQRALRGELAWPLWVVLMMEGEAPFPEGPKRQPISELHQPAEAAT